MEGNNLTTTQPTTPLAYPGSGDSPWDQIPLGETETGQVTWDTAEHAHMLISGSAGAGKSVAQRTILFHLLQHPGTWDFRGIDPNGTVLAPYTTYTDTVQEVSVSLRDSASLLSSAVGLMWKRYSMMSQEGVVKYSELSSPPKPVMVMSDSITSLIQLTGDSPEEDALRAQINMDLSEITQWGRSTGVHLVLSTDTPLLLRRSVKRNMTARIECGTTDNQGRGTFQFGTERDPYTMYSTPPTWIQEREKDS